MTFTRSQLQALEAYEPFFKTAVKARWARNPGRAALRVIWEIYTAATGDRRRFNDNCADCILRLLQDCGRVYFVDKEAATAAKSVKLTVGPAKRLPRRIKTNLDNG